MPLNALINHDQVLKNGADDPSALRAFLGCSRHSGLRLTRRVNRTELTIRSPPGRLCKELTGHSNETTD